MYILNGNKAELDKVVKEQRIRIQRGLITVTPIEDAGLTPPEEVNALRSENDGLRSENDDLRSKYDAKCTECENLGKEIEFLKNSFPTEAKDAKDWDRKDPPAADSKEAEVSDAKETQVEDSKKCKKGK